MLIRVKCPWCGSSDIEEQEEEYRESYGEFTCNDCDEDIYLDEIDYKVIDDRPITGVQK